jgi:hypothetical protein
LVAVMHLQILFDSCHSTIASYSCIRGWALGLSEAAVPPPAIPPQGLKKGAFPTWTNEVSCHTEQCGNILWSGISCKMVTCWKWNTCSPWYTFSFNFIQLCICN